jgi:mRNA interferase RelE/StbE
MRNSTPYRIRITETADEEMRRLPGHVRQRARRMVSDLASEPRPVQARELRERPGYYRIRLDSWRIIYQVDDEGQMVTVLRVRRKTGPETYQDLE